ncbi:MAG: transposase [Bacteroidota bacterium]
MLDLSGTLSVLEPILQVKIGLFRSIIKGIYSISSGGVTMKNISRWTGEGCSYRSIQRFFASPHDWLAMNLLLLRTVIFGIPDSNRYVLAVDEVVEKKAGKWTWGVNWFYSSIAGRPIHSVSNHVVSLVDTEKEHSFVLTHRQTTKESSTVPRTKKKRKKKASEKGKGKSSGQNKKSQKKKGGRPKGSKNKQNVKQQGLLYEGFEALLKLVVPLLLVICPYLKYVIGDGAYGNKTCCLIARELGLELISKLNRNTGLYLPYQGKYSGRGRPRKYGDKLDYQKLPKQYLVSTQLEKGIKTDVYQIAGVWTKTMPYLINVVIIIKTVIESGKSARVVLFSTDLTLKAEQIIKFYALRFQIEFNFRDAKQYFGLADFKNIKQQQVQNAVGLAFFMDNISLILIEQAKEVWKEDNISIQDLKAYYRAEKYLEAILNQHQFDPIRTIGAVNRTKAAA